MSALSEHIHTNFCTVPLNQTSIIPNFQSNQINFLFFFHLFIFYFFFHYVRQKNLFFKFVRILFIYYIRRKNLFFKFVKILFIYFYFIRKILTCLWLTCNMNYCFRRTHATLFLIMLLILFLFGFF